MERDEIVINENGKAKIVAAVMKQNEKPLGEKTEKIVYF